MVALMDRVATLRQSHALLLEEAHDARAITSGLRADLNGRVAAVEARLPAGTAGLTTLEDRAELAMLVMLVRDEIATAGRRAAAAPR
jgi:hypothetical protein